MYVMRTHVSCALTCVSCMSWNRQLWALRMTLGTLDCSKDVVNMAATTRQQINMQAQPGRSF